MGGDHGGNTVLVAVPGGVIGLAAGDRALEVALLVFGEVSFLKTDNVMRGEKGTGVSQLSGPTRPTRVGREAPNVIAAGTQARESTIGERGGLRWSGWLSLS